MGLSVPMNVDLFVKSCVGFTIYFYCRLSVSNLNSLNSLYGVYLVNFSLLVVLYIHIFSECVLMFSQLICHFGRIWRICIGLFCAKRFLGLSVPSSMGPSVPSFHGVVS